MDPLVVGFVYAKIVGELFVEYHRRQRFQARIFQEGKVIDIVQAEFVELLLC